MPFGKAVQRIPQQWFIEIDSRVTRLGDLYSCLEMIMRYYTAAGISLIILGVSVIAQEVVSSRPVNHASVVFGESSIEIPYDDLLVELFASTARDAGKKTSWEEQQKTVSITNYATLSAGTSGVMKAHLGSRGFSGLSSITIEVDAPYRVTIIDTGVVYASKLSEDSSLLLAIKVLWRTTRSLKEKSK